jgi:hypothetical protein
MNLIWDVENKSVRGSFVNLALTVIIVILIIIGAFDKDVCANLKTNESLITWFFGLSWTVWSAKQVATAVINKT